MHAAHSPRRRQPGRHVRPYGHRRASDGPLGRAARSRAGSRARARARARSGGRPAWRAWRSVGGLAGGQGQVRPGEMAHEITPLALTLTLTPLALTLTMLDVSL